MRAITSVIRVAGRRSSSPVTEPLTRREGRMQGPGCQQESLTLRPSTSRRVVMAAEERTGKYADLVCEGGGVKGIGLAGAYAMLEERGYEAKNVAGTSAGAITAALIAPRYHAAGREERSVPLDFREFQDEGWEDKLPLVDRSASILLDRGIYEGQRFYDWMKGLLDAKGVRTFRDLVIEGEDDPKYRSRLQVVVSDVTGRRLLVLPKDAGKLGYKDPDDLEVALAVRRGVRN